MNEGFYGDVGRVVDFSTKLIDVYRGDYTYTWTGERLTLWTALQTLICNM